MLPADVVISLYLGSTILLDCGPMVLKRQRLLDVTPLLHHPSVLA